MIIGEPKIENKCTGCGRETDPDEWPWMVSICALCYNVCYLTTFYPMEKPCQV
jgi:hypothetical protein